MTTDSTTYQALTNHFQQRSLRFRALYHTSFRTHYPATILTHRQAALFRQAGERGRAIGQGTALRILLKRRGGAGKWDLIPRRGSSTKSALLSSGRTEEKEAVNMWLKYGGGMRRELWVKVGRDMGVSPRRARRLFWMFDKQERRNLRLRTKD
ncbi:hypothetical protein IAT38_002018 [Cryptococcus sp. DSM 104549]